MQIPTDWLTERVESVPTSYDNVLPPKDALRVRMAWQRLKRAASEGDELWAFTSPRSSWNRKAKYSGYVLVRDGKVLDGAVLSRD